MIELVIWSVFVYAFLGTIWAVFMIRYAYEQRVSMSTRRVLRHWVGWPYYLWRVFLR